MSPATGVVRWKLHHGKAPHRPTRAAKPPASLRDLSGNPLATCLHCCGVVSPDRRRGRPALARSVDARLLTRRDLHSATVNSARVRGCASAVNTLAADPGGRVQWRPVDLLLPELGPAHRAQLSYPL